MKPKEYISKRRRYALRDTIGNLMTQHDRTLKYLAKGDTFRREVSEKRFYAAAERLIDLHRGIPDE